MSEEKNNILDDEELEEVSGGTSMNKNTVYIGKGETATAAFGANKKRNAKSLVYTTDKGANKVTKQTGDTVLRANC